MTPTTKGNQTDNNNSLKLDSALASNPKCSNPNCDKMADSYCEDCGHCFCQEHNKHDR